MGEDTRQIAQTIREERNELGRNLDELQQHAKALTDWHTHYRRNVGPSLAVAFGGGVILGLLAAGRSSSVGRRRWGATGQISTAPATPQRSSSGKLAALKTLADNPRARRQMGDMWDDVLEALIGVASAKALDLIGSAVPGFRDEYRARATSRPGHGEVPRRPDMSAVS